MYLPIFSQLCLQQTSLMISFHLNSIDLIQISCLIAVILIIMKLLLTLLIASLFAILSTAQSALSCAQYIANLQTLYNTSRPEFTTEMAPFLLWSGKIMDDLGFPISCVKNPSNAFWEVEVSLTQPDGHSELTMYYGFCFINVCDAQMLNQYSGFFINALLQNMTETDYHIDSAEFHAVNMDVEYTAGSIIVSILISLFILSRLASSFGKWGRLCVSDSEEEALAVESGDLQEDKEAGRMPQHTLTFLEKYSLERAFGKLFEKQNSDKIYAFSLFKIISMPIIALGYLFYLSNFGAYNYFSFDNEIYQTVYAKIATFAYYLPDIFYFISGFVFARKLIRLDNLQRQNQTVDIVAAFLRKLVKLYPLYLAIILIYQFVTPSIHAGPLWNVYEGQIAQCDHNWWRSFLMIDNWWANGCYSYSWYVQVEVQFALIACLIFVLYSYKRDIALYVVYLLLIGSFISLFFGGQLPSSIQTATSNRAQIYFQSFYSHLFFYLFGIFFAILFEKLSVRTFVKDLYGGGQTLHTISILVAFSLILLIVARPGVWENSLGLQLAFCRIGVMISFLMFFLKSLAHDDNYESSVHRLSRLTYGIILCIGMVTASGFWGINTFSYVDGINMMQSSLTYLLISVAIGGALGVSFDVTPFVLGA